MRDAGCAIATGGSASGISPPASRFAISVTGLSSRNRTTPGCRNGPSSVHSLYRTSAISAGSTQVCPASWGTGPEKAGVGRMPRSSAALTSLSSAAVNPLPTRPPYTSFPSWYAPRSSAPNPEREPLGRVKPTTTKSSVRSARILSQLGERPARYGASAFFATIPSSPIFTTCSYSASPSFSKCERYLSGPTRGTRSEEHTSELQSRLHLVCRLLLEKKKTHRLCATLHYVTDTVYQTH